jgi:hypothetical protein
MKRTTGWRVSFALAGVALLIGGPLHPAPDTHLGFDQATARMLADPHWVPAHTAMLMSFALIGVGLWLLYRSGDVSGTLRTAVGIATAASVLSVIELVFHLLAYSEAAALSAGRSTPLVDIHIALAVVAYPAIGLSLAAVAWLGGRTRALTHPIIGAVGALGGLLHAIAAPLVVLTKDQSYSVLFKGAILFVPWLVALAVTRRVGSQDETTAVTRSAPAEQV